MFLMRYYFFFFKQKTAYEIYQCDWSSDVCSSDLYPYGFVRRKVVLSRADKLSELTVVGFFNNHHSLGWFPPIGCGGWCLRCRQIPLRPGRQDRGHVSRVCSICQQVVGAVDGHEALRVVGGFEDARGVLDADQIVVRRVHHEQCAVERFRSEEHTSELQSH